MDNSTSRHSHPYRLLSAGQSEGRDGGVHEDSSGDVQDRPRLPAGGGAEGAQPSAKKSMVLGGASLFVCVVSFVFQTAITHRVQETYSQPFFILWVSHSFWMIMLPLHTLYEKMKPSARSLAALKQDALVASAKVIVQRKRPSHASEESGLTSASGGGDDGYSRVEPIDADEMETVSGGVTGQEAGESAAGMHDVFKVTDNEEDEQNDSGGSSGGSSGMDSGLDESRILVRNRPVWVVVHAAALATALVGLLNASAYLWYVAVGLTSMSKVTAIYNMSCFFAYVFSILLLKERVMVVKCVAVMLSIVGVVFMTLVNNGADAQEARVKGGQSAAVLLNRELFGDLMALVCACGIGLYQVLYKKYAVPRNYHSLYYVNFMTTLLGLGTFAVCWFPIPLLHVLRVEVFHWPSRQQLVLVLANAFFGVAYNAGFMIALSVLSPLFAAIGVMLTIPVTAIVDMIAQGQVLAWNVFAGGAGILAGFAMLTFAEYKETVRKTAGRAAAPDS
ncbi:hypothetical protein EV175_004372 [Coemansia sp. RSA 1933]|nr:hypothetical protein EV175_004372 [Coemansia sp. RSA 1933]